MFKDQWADVPLSYHKHEVLKVGGKIKFFACPARIINSKTWELLGLVNETTDGETNILHMPFAGSYLDQPEWYREAVKIVRSARAENYRANK